MGRELFIVRPDRVDLYRYLTETFAHAPGVEIIWDRRSRTRRTSSSRASAERRRADRRTRPAVDEELRVVGYAFVVLD